MITEDYVSFETAKLLKEMGFDEEVLTYYIYDTESKSYEFRFDDRWDNPNNFPGDCVSAPTLQMAMKWLREAHKIHIQIWILEENGYWFDIEKILNARYKHKSLYSTGLEDIYFNSYEEACEAAIKYCLENLI